MAVTIEKATRDDLPALAEINRLAYAGELAFRFAYREGAEDKHVTEFFAGRLAHRLGTPGTEIWKAVDPATAGGRRRICGFVCLTLEMGDEPNGTPSTAMVLQKKEEQDQQETMLPFLNAEYVVATGAAMEQLRDYMKGEMHYYLSAFAVLPEHQGLGIGATLLNHCVRIAEDRRLALWLIALPGSHGLFLRLGFRDVDCRDVDLNAWDHDRMRGYGLYRAYAMVRRPL
ncbi:acyl-CoA N-acyltransferase [Xylariomycetidae sp. FL2044]|nr:acyl-CoA N-acyltransferase [Xylariomycetidae sp. FL2044]